MLVGGFSFQKDPYFGAYSHVSVRERGKDIPIALFFLYVNSVFLPLVSDADSSFQYSVAHGESAADLR